MANTTFRWDTTVTNLIAESGQANGEVAVVQGYAAAGDGGGGTFYFDTSLLTKETVTGVANSSGVFEITTSANHTLMTGQRAWVGGITGTGGMTAAVNGTWTITKTADTKFTLDGSTFAGTYTSGGAIGNGAATLPSNSATAGMWRRLS